MTCPVCGKELPCAHVLGSATVLLDQQTAADMPSLLQSNSAQSAARESNWRKEVASRVQLHRARRHRRGDLDAAMEFDFGPEEALAVTEEPVVRGRLSRYSAKQSYMPPAETEDGEEHVAGLPAPEPPKVIRFPRQPTTAPNHQLHDWRLQPELSQALPEMPPRILDHTEPGAVEPEARCEMVDYATELPRPASPPPAEQMELLPSFDDIRLESGHMPVQSDDDAPPRPASLQHRLFAGAVDVGAVLLAGAVFEITFVYLAEDNPHSRMAMLCGLCVSAVLWILFQYLFLVHGRGTPGMRLAELELVTLEGKPASRHACRCRALASTLSGLAIGLGYAWALVDEDQLGWHDRITGTLVCSPGERSTDEAELWG
jgi:uncharacterized RDD family membrane protein YckC